MPPTEPLSTESNTTERGSGETGRLRPGENQVLVRMYGQGLGDCFLLAFPRASADGAGGAGSRPVYVLVDCGVIGRTPNGKQRMRAIVQDIKVTTRDDTIAPAAGEVRGHLDLLIITHEHWDHLSGFLQASEDWRSIQVDELWTSWIEKEDDPGGLPLVLRQILERQRLALAEVARRALQFGLRDEQSVLLGLTAFLSDSEEGLAFGTAPTSRNAFAAAKALVPQAKHICCEQGDVRGVPDTNVVGYVLGPPRNEAFLRQMRPSAENPETYAMADMLNGRSLLNAFAMPLLGPYVRSEGDAASPNLADSRAVSAARNSYDGSFPFDGSVGVPLPDAEELVQVDPSAYPSLAGYLQPINHWRRIDFDWLGAAEAFALAADSLANNLSLVVAFELPPGEGAEQSVLLFAADAQVGNWLSWYEIEEWKPQGGVVAAQVKPDIADLLQRTIFYKVGHHGSHNATLKTLGVERMRPDGNFTAFVPVSPKVAREIMSWCAMPLDSLLTALSQRSHGRVVLPNGNVWPLAREEEVAKVRDRLGLTVSSEQLAPLVRDGKEIEGAVPLWVQVAIDY